MKVLSKFKILKIQIKYYIGVGKKLVPYVKKNILLREIIEKTADLKKYVLSSILKFQ